MKLNSITSAALLAGAASAHMNMAYPKPFGNPDSSPLAPSGSDYPCKLPQTNNFVRDNITTITAGTTMPLKFKGSAVHGGGSCQVSLTKDLVPTANSDFKVIYSIEGGCPQSDFDIPIPQDAPNGDYTLAWTWFNQIGNREMYMNCAPVTLSGSNGTDTSFSSLPDIAIYNVASKNSCKTQEMKDVQFGNPGKYLLNQSSRLASPAGCNGADAPAPVPSSGAILPPYSNSSAPYSNSSSSSMAGMAIVPVGPSSASSTFASMTATPVATPAPASPAAVGIAAYASLPTCPVDGALVCSADGTQFGLCNWGHVVMMPVAAGTSCSNGVIVKRSAKFRY